MQKINSKKILLWLAIVLGIVGIGMVFLALNKEINKKKEIQKIINNLQAEAMRLDSENSDLAEKIEYLQSDDYKKREAKDKLNLQAEGESVVVIKPNLAKKEIIQEKGEKNNKDIVIEVEKSNSQKWWEYFFKY